MAEQRVAEVQLVPRREPSEPRTPVERLRAGLLDTASLRALPAPTPLVDGLLFRDTLAMLYGGSGVGKSFLALDVALHVAAGAWWHRRSVAAGPVLYIVAEGGMGFGRRVEAWERHNGLHADKLPVLWYPHALNLFEVVWVAALVEVISELMPALIIIDTFARCSLGAEENSARDIGRMVSHLDTIRRVAGSCVWLVHHSGKNTAAGARGSSALRGAMDTELEAVGDARRFDLHTRKQKDAPEIGPIPLGLRHVHGVASMALDRPAENLRADDAAHHSAEALAALVAIDVPGGASTSAWRLASGLTERTFYRHRKVLLDAGQVVNVGSEARPRYRPVAEQEDEL
jgi:hypothetical protein